MSALIKREKILILVKTYPTYSKTYYELVCTAGINENGEWRRIYPVPFRDLPEPGQYKKYQWIEADIVRQDSDLRPESYRLNGEIEIISEPLSTDDYWHERKEILGRVPVYTCLDEIIAKAKIKNELSLCHFRPKKILRLKVEDCEREWNKEILRDIKMKNKQMPLFAEMEKEIQLVRKLPYKFSYVFTDENDRESTLMIEDWEIGALYWNCWKKNRNEQEACAKVKEKYEGFIRKNDVTLFLGTTLKYHTKAKNPFVIIGVFCPPKQKNKELF